LPAITPFVKRSGVRRIIQSCHTLDLGFRKRIDKNEGDLLMIRSTHGPALFAAGLLVMPPAQGADWTGKGELGALLARGNAATTSADAKLDVAVTSVDWKNAAHLALRILGKKA